MRVYIAGPYTHPDPVINTRLAIEAAERLMLADTAITPYVPHLSMLWHLVSPHDLEWWYAFDLRWLEACDAVLRLPGASRGAEAEVEHARKLGIPVFGDEEELLYQYKRGGSDGIGERAMSKAIELRQGHGVIVDLTDLTDQAGGIEITGRYLECQERHEQLMQLTLTGGRKWLIIAIPLAEIE